MTSESKILTVSYGTFSCTLEGFEDPFNTMKAIAEYFRDLAGDDRYFGAEPPQPDAAMLHRIAEREVSRIVDSRVGENSVALRPQPAGPGDAHAPTARVSTQARQPRDADPAAAGVDLVPEPTLQDMIPTGVAAKLARIRQSVNPPFVPAAVAEAALDALDAAEREAAEHVAAENLAAENLAADAAGEDLAETAFAAPEAAEAPKAEAPKADAGDVLSRLDALMADPSVEDDLDDAPVADSADTDNAFGDVFEADAAPMLEDAQPEGEAADSVVAAQVDSWLLQTEADATLDAEPQAGADTLLDAVAEPLAEDDPAPFVADADDVLPEDLAAADLTLAEALAADPLPEDAPSAEPFVEDTPVAATPEPAAAPTLKSGAKTKRVSSRVVRIHPDEEEVATPRDPNTTRGLDGAKDEDFARLLRHADDVMSDEDNRRRLDSIAHLKAAVAATEADRAAGTETKPAAGTRQDAYRDDLAQVAPPEAEAPPPPEVKPRRKTISVRPQEPRPGTIRPGMISPPPLVLVSEQRIDRVPPPAPAYTPPPAPAYAPQPDGQPMVALRTGRLTGAIGAAAASPVAPQHKLVLEQRAVHADPEDEEDVNDDLSLIDEAGLMRFAEQVGVKSMADMLEAAAAYATCVESRSQFTRPQLMRRLMASAGGKPVSREDGLRSFGTLLRTGRIEKVSRGHYVLAEHSPYLAEARRLG